MRVLLILVAAATILSGCNFDVPLYVSDLRDVSNGSEASIWTPATLGLEVESCDEYEQFAEETPEFAAGVGTGLVSGLRTKGCVVNQHGHFIQAEAQVPIVTDATLWREMDSMFGVLATDHGGNISVTLLVDQHKQEVLWNRLEGEENPLPDASKVTITVILENDLRDLQTYVAESVFVEGLAFVEPRTIRTQETPDGGYHPIERSHIAPCDARRRTRRDPGNCAGIGRRARWRNFAPVSGDGRLYRPGYRGSARSAPTTGNCYRTSR